MGVAVDPARVGRVEQARARSAAERVGWLLPAMVLTLFALKPLGPIRDADAYWHVVAGQHLVQTGQFVLDDPFGAATEKAWILNQWVPEVLMYALHSAYGLAGVAWLLCAGSLLVGLAVLRACRSRASHLATALVLAVVFVALSGSLSPRPQLVTFALTAVTTGAWLLTREDGRPRWWLVLVTWLWACSHGMWFMGPVVGGAVVVGMALERRVSLRSTARLALVPLLSVVAAALTPVGPRLLTSPFQVAEVTPYISEWQRPDLTDPAVVAALTLVLVVGVNLLRAAPFDWTTILLTLAALGLMLTWARAVGLGAVIAAPMAVTAVQNLMRQPVRGAPKHQNVAVHIAGVMSLLVVGIAAPAVANTPAVGALGLNSALDALPRGTVVCNDQVDGGWLMLSHPQLHPTMDTRIELYSVQHIEAYLGFIAGTPGWQAYPTQVRCAFALLPADAPVVSRMRVSGEWAVVAQSTGDVLLRSSR